MAARVNPIESAIQSPCVKICTLDAAAGCCLGCGRSIEEIARWTRISDAERAAIMAELPARLTRAAPVAAKAE